MRVYTHFLEYILIFIFIKSGIHEHLQAVSMYSNFGFLKYFGFRSVESRLPSHESRLPSQESWLPSHESWLPIQYFGSDSWIPGLDSWIPGLDVWIPGSWACTHWIPSARARKFLIHKVSMYSKTVSLCRCHDFADYHWIHLRIQHITGNNDTFWSL